MKKSNIVAIAGQRFRSLTDGQEEAGSPHYTYRCTDCGAIFWGVSKTGVFVGRCSDCKQKKADAVKDIGQKRKR